MKRKRNVVIWMVILVWSVTLYGDIKHETDPRGKIENILGEGSFNGKMEKKEITWRVKGAGQDWVFTRFVPKGKSQEAFIKIERFWITIIRVDGQWVTRLKYRFKEVKPEEVRTYDVSEKDKGSKYKAKCRITENKIILTAIKKKKGFLFRISKKAGSIHVTRTSIHSLKDSVISLHKQK